MLIQATLDKMTALHLTAMAEAFQRQRGSPEWAELSFEDRVGMLVETEWSHREQRRLQQRLRAANLRYPASLEDIDWRAPRRGLDRAQVLSLGTCAWIQQHHNLILIGPTGIGKSWLASAFAERGEEPFHGQEDAMDPGERLRHRARQRGGELLDVEALARRVRPRGDQRRPDGARGLPGLEEAAIREVRGLHPGAVDEAGPADLVGHGQSSCVADGDVTATGFEWPQIPRGAQLRDLVRGWGGR